jgi:peroxin-2
VCARLRHAQTVEQQLHGGRSGVEGPGLSLQQRLAYAGGGVLAPYAWLRLHRAAAAQGWAQEQGAGRGAAAWRLLRRADAAHRLAALANLWLFLWQGRYRCVAGGARVTRALSARARCCA